MEQPQEMRRIAIWSGWLRLAHGGLALSTLLLMASGWLLQHTAGVETLAADLHNGAAGVFAVTLGLRLWLLVREKTSGNWRALFPDPIPVEGIKQTLLFYLSFGRAGLPRWHAHNPLWAPVYAFMLLLMVVMLFSGLLMGPVPLLFSTLYLPSLHSAAASWLGLLVTAHILTAVWHDVKSDNSNISAMLNGYRVFSWNKPVQEQSPQVMTFHPRKPQ